MDPEPEPLVWPVSEGLCRVFTKRHFLFFAKNELRLKTHFFRTNFVKFVLELFRFVFVSFRFVIENFRFRFVSFTKLSKYTLIIFFTEIMAITKFTILKVKSKLSDKMHLKLYR